MLSVHVHSIVHLLAAVFPSVLRYVKLAKTRESKDAWDGLMALISRINDDVVGKGTGSDVSRDALTKLLDTMAVVSIPSKVLPAVALSCPPSSPSIF